MWQGTNEREFASKLSTKTRPKQPKIGASLCVCHSVQLYPIIDHQIRGQDGVLGRAFIRLQIVPGELPVWGNKRIPVGEWVGRFTPH